MAAFKNYSNPEEQLELSKELKEIIRAMNFHEKEELVKARLKVNDDSLLSPTVAKALELWGYFAYDYVPNSLKEIFNITKSLCFKPGISTCELIEHLEDLDDLENPND